MFKKVIKFAAYMLAGLNLGVASGLCPMLLAVLFAIRFFVKRKEGRG